jgi:hypothetical protein
MIFWIAQIIGLLAVATNLFAMWRKEKKHMSLFIAAAGALYTINLALLGGWSGATVCLVGAVQAIADYLFRKHKKKPSPANLSVAFGIISAILASLAFKSWIDILPIVTAVIGTLVIAVKKEQTSRIVFITNSLIWGVYSILILAVAAAIGDGIQVVVTFWAFIHYKKKPEQLKKKQGARKK